MRNTQTHLERINGLDIQPLALETVRQLTPISILAKFYTKCSSPVPNKKRNLEQRPHKPILMSKPRIPAANCKRPRNPSRLFTTSRPPSYLPTHPHHQRRNLRSPNESNSGPPTPTSAKHINHPLSHQPRKLSAERTNEKHSTRSKPTPTRVPQHQINPVQANDQNGPNSQTRLVVVCPPGPQALTSSFTRPASSNTKVVSQPMGRG